MFIRCFGQAGRGRGAAVARGRVGGPQARGPVRGGRNPAATGVGRGPQRPAARGGVVRAKGSLPGEDGLYLRDELVSFFLSYLKKKTKNSTYISYILFFSDLFNYSLTSPFSSPFFHVSFLNFCFFFPFIFHSILDLVLVHFTFLRDKSL